MQINKVNSTSHFGATIRNTRALKQFINSLCEGSGYKDGYGSMPRQFIIDNFSRIHKYFPQKTDEVVFTKHTNLAYGHFIENTTKNIVEGFVKSEGKKANFAFTYDWREFIQNHGPNPFYIKKMENAFWDTSHSIKMNKEQEAVSIIQELTKIQ